MSCVELQHVEIVAADSVHGKPCAGELAAGNLRNFLGQEAELRALRFFPLASLCAIARLGFYLALPGFASALAVFDLSAYSSQNARVVPRLEDEVTNAFTHDFDSEFDASPGGHGNDGKKRVAFVNLGKQVETFASRGCVARVVEVH